MPASNPPEPFAFRVGRLLAQDEVAERVGFEPTVPCGTHAFQACEAIEIRALFRDAGLELPAVGLLSRDSIGT